ncbi:AraC family transcriptional regulator [Frateuria aurantia]
MPTIVYRDPANLDDATAVYSHPQLVAEVDRIPRPVAAKLSTHISRHWERATHLHRKAQLLYSVRGLLHCQVEDGIWLVPPQCALWIPGGLPHAVRGSGEAECYCLFVEPASVAGLPEACCTLTVSVLLRELLMKAAGYAELYPRHGKEERLVATLLDELTEAPLEDLHLPIPRDPRLRRLTDLLLAQPADKRAAGDWAEHVGMSERHMSRLLMQEIGMSFGQWRRQLHITLAVQQLTRGDSVQSIAMGLGYENASGFVAMFRKVVGKPPGRYLAERAGAAIAAALPHSATPISMPA